MALTKRDIVSRIAEEADIKQANVKVVVQKMLDCIVESLVKGQKIELRNFGVFKIKSRRARIGRNPRTGAAVPVPPKKAVVFKAGMMMKKKVV